MNDPRIELLQRLKEQIEQAITLIEDGAVLVGLEPKWRINTAVLPDLLIGDFAITDLSKQSLDKTSVTVKSGEVL